MTLITSYPPQSGVVETVVKLINAVHHVMICRPISLLEPIIFAVQRGLALWIEDKFISLSEEQYNDLVRNLIFQLYRPVVLFSRLHSSCLSTIHSLSV
jgi:hypothetical protein